MATWTHYLWTIACLCLTGFFAHAQSPANVPSPPIPEITVASEATETPKQSPAFFEEFLSNPLWLMMAMLLVFYVGVLLPSQRSNRRQQKEHAELISNLKKNDRVVTSFGVHGVVVSNQPESGTVTIRLDDTSNAKMTVNRDTIRVVKKD